MNKLLVVIICLFIQLNLTANCKSYDNNTIITSDTTIELKYYTKYDSSFSATENKKQAIALAILEGLDRAYGKLYVSSNDLTIKNQQEDNLNSTKTTFTSKSKSLVFGKVTNVIKLDYKIEVQNEGSINEHGNIIQNKINYILVDIIFNASKLEQPIVFSDDVETIVKKTNEIQQELDLVVENPIQTAVNLFLNKDYTHAIKYYLIGLNRLTNLEYGKKYAYFFFLSEAYLNNNNINEAIKYTDSILLINPVEVQALIIKTRALIKLNRYEEGVTLFKNLINNNNLIGNMEFLMKSLYKFSMSNRSVILRGMKIDFTLGEGLEFRSKIQYESFEEFKKDYKNISSGYVRNISSSGYQFKQFWEKSELISLYGNLLSEEKIDPIKIAQMIEEFNSGSDSSDIFNVKYQTGLYGNTVTGIILDSSLYVIAKTGKAYVGSAHFDSIGDALFGLGVFSNKNSNPNNYIIKTYDSIKQIQRRFMVNQYSANIECPCDALLERKVYDELKKNKTNIVINSNDYASKYFQSAWYYLLSGQYGLSIDRFQAVINYYIKYSRSIDGLNLPQEFYDSYRMAIINLGHAYLLSGNYQQAKLIYLNKILYRDFGDSFDNLSKADIIKKDWIDFIEKGLITKLQILEFNNNFKIINDF